MGRGEPQGSFPPPPALCYVDKPCLSRPRLSSGSWTSSVAAGHISGNRGHLLLEPSTDIFDPSAYIKIKVLLLCVCVSVCVYVCVCRDREMHVDAGVPYGLHV